MQSQTTKEPKQAPTAQPKNVIILELNEFNTDLLKTATQQHNLPHIQSLLEKANSTNYKTNDRYNSGYLEPWVQWVSIHAGVPSSQHKIKHLGDVPDLHYTQAWETLSQHNISTGVWGVMNGVRRDQEHVKFFLPDPWTFSEAAYPEKLNNLLNLPRYLSRNYRNLKITKILGKSFKLLSYIFSSGVGLKISAQIIKLLGSLIKRGPKHYVFISYFDYVSTLLFIQMKKKYNPKCNFIFLNSIAHIQHHHWKNGPEGVTPEILFGLKMIDKILDLLKSHFPDDALVVHNGLSQMNTNHERPWVLYRQKDPLQFLEAMQLKPTKIEQLMTHDGHAFFKTATDCQFAFEQLKTIRINNKPLFHVEYNTEDELKLFYQLSFTDTLESPTRFECNHNHFRFFDYFDRIVTRTGRHIPMGTVFSHDITFVDHMFNHEFNKYVFHYLNPEKFPLIKTNQFDFSATLNQISASSHKTSEALCTQ